MSIVKLANAGLAANAVGLNVTTAFDIASRSFLKLLFGLTILYS